MAQEVGGGQAAGGGGCVPVRAQEESEGAEGREMRGAGAAGARPALDWRRGHSFCRLADRGHRSWGRRPVSALEEMKRRQGDREPSTRPDPCYVVRPEPPAWGGDAGEEGSAGRKAEGREPSEVQGRAAPGTRVFAWTRGGDPARTRCDRVPFSPSTPGDRSPSSR